MDERTTQSSQCRCGLGDDGIIKLIDGSTGRERRDVMVPKVSYNGAGAGAD